MIILICFDVNSVEKVHMVPSWTRNFVALHDVWMFRHYSLDISLISKPVIVSPEQNSLNTNKYFPSDSRVKTLLLQKRFVVCMLEVLWHCDVSYFLRHFSNCKHRMILTKCYNSISKLLKLKVASLVAIPWAKCRMV